MRRFVVFPFRSLSFFALFCLVAISSGHAQQGEAPADEQPEKQPVLAISDIRGGRGDRVSVPVEAANVPSGATAIEWTLDLRLEEIDEARIAPGGDLPLNSRLSLEKVEGDGPAFRGRVEAPRGGTLEGGGEIASIIIQVPNRIVQRRTLAVENPRVTLADGSTQPMEKELGTIAVSVISDPATLFAFLTGIVALIFWLSTLKRFETFFRYLPPLIWMYFVPMVMTTFGITPDASPLYSPFMSRVILPAILVLLLIPSDIRSIIQLGPKAIAVMLFATAGIVTGALVSLTIFTKLTPGMLPEESWKGVAALSGSWIGGSPNMTAVIESVGTPPSMIGPLIVVDTVLAYSWLGLLIALSAYQKRIDHHHGADDRIIEDISNRLEAEQEAHSRAPGKADVAFMLAIAFVVSQACLFLGEPLYYFFNDVMNWTAFSEVVNSYGWAILLITAAGLAMSTTRVRHLDFCGASSLGYIGLYLLLTTYGARANLRAVFEVPQFFALGFVWLLIHIAFLYVGVRVTKAPIFLGATSSMANIGGTASAPVVAAAYNQSMAPVGLLMAILGSTMGTPLSLFVISTVGRAIEGG